MDKKEKKSEWKRERVCACVRLYKRVCACVRLCKRVSACTTVKEMQNKAQQWVTTSSFSEKLDKKFHVFRQKLPKTEAETSSCFPAPAGVFSPKSLSQVFVTVDQGTAR